MNIINFKNSKMTKYYQVLICISLCLALNVFNTGVLSQEQEIKLKGVVLETGTELPLKQAIISVIATGNIAETNEAGEFEIVVPDLQTEIMVNLPAYNQVEVVHLTVHFVVNLN